MRIQAELQKRGRRISVAYVKGIGLTLAACLLLNACGGGGGSDRGGTQPPPPPPSNAAPTIGGDPVTSIHAGGEYSFTPTADDADGDALLFEIANAPHWAAFDESTGELSGTPLTSNVGDYNDIVITVTDGEATAVLPVFSLTVLAQILNTGNFTTEGEVTPVGNGYHSVGDLVMNTGERIQRFEDADLLLDFDADGKLIDFSGETLLPSNISDTVTIASPVRAVVGMMTGAEINADDAFGILLQEETNYFVFFVSTSLDLVIGDRSDPGAVESVTLETPVGGEILIITDPTDPFLYRYGSQALIGTAGRGESTNGLIPFVPQLSHPELDSFSGHELVKGSMGLGVKVFDFFEISGTRVVKNPQFGDIDWEDPFESEIEFRAGLNGDAQFSFSILSVGLFSFDLARTSATLDVGLDRQSMAMQTRVAPDVSWVPDWFPFVPTTEVVGDWFVNGDGEFSASLGGSYRSIVPPADIAGRMQISNEGTILSGTTGDAEGEFTVSAEFRDNATMARVEFEEDFTAGLTGEVTAALDRQLAAAQQALDDLEAAIADYEFELSLRGLRSALPGIADAAISVLNGIPGTVRDAVDNATVAYIRDECITVVFAEVCLSSVVNENAIGDTTGADARNQATAKIAPYISMLGNLKTQAQNADSESLREALRLALLAVHGNQEFSETITVTYDFPEPFADATVYNQTVERRIIPVATAEQILAAANNIHRIGETSDIMISAQAIYDAFPTEEVFATTRQEVEDGLAQIPTLDGMGVTISGGAVDAFVTLGQQDYRVGFNVLNPTEATEGVAAIIAEQLLADAD